MRGRRGLRPETFEFLGFKHACGVDRRGRFALIRIPSTKSCRLLDDHQPVAKNSSAWRESPEIPQSFKSPRARRGRRGLV